MITHKTSSFSTIQLRRSLLLLTRQLFSSPGNYFEYTDLLQGWIYDDDPAVRTLGVDLFGGSDPSNPAKIPSILLSVGDQSFQPEFVAGGGAIAPDYSRQTIIKAGTTMLQWACNAPSMDNSDALADIVTTFFAAMKMPMQRVLQLTAFDVNGKTAPKLIKQNQSNDYWQTFVRVDARFNLAVDLVTESHRFKKIILNVFPQADANL